MKDHSKNPYKRADRVGDMIARELALAMLEKVSDPRIKKCTITTVTISDDLKNAKVFFSLVNGAETEVKQTLRALEKAEGFFKRVIGDNLKLRYTPSLRFIYDNSMEHGSNILTLINQVAVEHEPEDQDD
jgi:ribosome-binding factor A